MATKVEDPVTGTNWFDPDSPGKTLRTWIVAVFGIAALFTAIGLAQNTVQPLFSQAINSVPMLDTGDSGQTIRVEG